MFKEKNPQWKGNKVGRSALHAWIKHRLKKPIRCSNCSQIGPVDLANISQEYKRDLTDWEWLCRKCHMKKDGRMEKLIKYRINLYNKEEVGILAKHGPKYIFTNNLLPNRTLSSIRGARSRYSKLGLVTNNLRGDKSVIGTKDGVEFRFTSISKAATFVSNSKDNYKVRHAITNTLFKNKKRRSYGYIWRYAS